ncbi:hypothetical protein OG730_38270 [Streptomyces sp. NBC_01298]|uniref:hypothetical protein n=1 Tax=Streptomyces sp. NBC_01298 TaxID=2903817 RepID=UPI002E0D703C|nr:hypothetical protein OG730_38270 [Streptomyces sp. NBC_01298]
MENRADTEGRPTETGLTTEDLAHPVTDDEAVAPGAPVYPGEATRDRAVRETPATREDPRVYEERDDLENREEFENREDFGNHEMRDEVAPPPEEDRTVAPAGADTPPGGAVEGDSEPLLGASDTQEYRQSWTDIQGRFVDDPQDAVRSADTLVAEVMQTLAGTFAAHKQELEAQWGRGEEVETEDLRQALQHYRSFFNRLLKT